MICFVFLFADNKSLTINPNAGLAGIMEYVRSSLTAMGRMILLPWFGLFFCRSSLRYVVYRLAGVSEKDHIELCDESGKLINPDDFPKMMLLSAFVRPGVEETFFIPVRVERERLCVERGRLCVCIMATF